MSLEGIKFDALSSGKGVVKCGLKSSLNVNIVQVVS